MIGNFGQTHETEAHAEAQQTTRTSDITDARHFLRLAKSLGIGLFDKDIDDGQILTGVFMNFTFDGFRDGFVVHGFRSPPVVSVAIRSGVG